MHKASKTFPSSAERSRLVSHAPVLKRPIAESRPLAHASAAVHLSSREFDLSPDVSAAALSLVILGAVVDI